MTAKKRTKKRPCPSCGSLFIRGTMVLRITLDGAVRQRVCKGCASLAVPVLASDRPAYCEVCGKNHARVCVSCVAEAMRDQRAADRLVKRIPSAGKDPKASPDEWGPA
jgi:hypothetical protein